VDILQTIMAERRQDVAAARAQIPLSDLERAASSRIHHSFADRLHSGAQTCVIAEMKKASPSAGILRDVYEPAELARGYTHAGASALSVLTEPRHFMGCEFHLRSARAATDLPILRKDFMCDVYQVVEAAAWGADIVLLIVAALSPVHMRELYAAAGGLGLDVLVEAHTADEIELALSLEQAIVGVNSRNLKTLKTDLDVARALASLIPSERASVAESGIRTREEILELESLGYRGFLIGEALVREDDPAGRLCDLIS